jgi:hypothetical protein
MAAATYADSTDIQPLIGNLAAQRSTTAVNNAIAGASTYVNLYLGRTSNVDDTDPLLPLLKTVTRYLAAAELLTGVQSQEATKQSLLDQANNILQNISKLEQSDEIQSTIVDSSEAYTWPANPSGEVYSNNYKNMRRYSNYSYYDIGNLIVHDGDYADPE